MTLFSVTKYEAPDPKNANIEKKYNVDVFMATYISERCRVGEPREHKIISTFSIFAPIFSCETYAAAEELLIQKEETINGFHQLHDLFVVFQQSSIHLNQR